MDNLIDIHTHALPCVDDGAQSVEKAIRILRAALEQGTDTMILTPHYRRGYGKKTVEEIRDSFRNFSRLAAVECPRMRLYLGTEISYEVDLPEKLQRGEVLTMADSRYLLVEFLPNTQFSRITHAIDELLYSGYVPVIAHAERYSCLYEKKNRPELLLDMGALLQLNAGSVAGNRGLKVKWFCGGLLKRGMVSFVASDTHDDVERPPNLQKAADYVQRKYGQDYARLLFCENGKKLICDQDL